MLTGRRKTLKASTVRRGSIFTHFGKSLRWRPVRASVWQSAWMRQIGFRIQLMKSATNGAGKVQKIASGMFLGEEVYVEFAAFVRLA